MKKRKIPGYLITFAALLIGIILGGFFPEQLKTVAVTTRSLIKFLVKIVPIFIFVALSPSIATLIKRGLAGRFAASVILWFVMTSTLAGLIGVSVSSMIFHIPFTGGSGAMGFKETINMVWGSGAKVGATMPLLAILLAVGVGVIANWIDPLYKGLKRIQEGFASSGGYLSYIMIPLTLFLGITIGVRFGARLGMAHYVTMVLYTLVICAAWMAIYFFVIIGKIAKQPLKKVFSKYFVPTSIFAAATCSSMVTLPINLANSKKYGVRDEIADFVIPFGAVANMDASALAYMAYGPFVIHYIFGFELNWTLMLLAWPAIVLFTIAAPGLPAGMGTALWSATLFSSILGMEDPTKTTFITTWLALSGGIPDMIRTTVNATGDGFASIFFESVFDKHFAKKDNTINEQLVTENNDN